MHVAKYGAITRLQSEFKRIGNFVIEEFQKEYNRSKNMHEMVKKYSNEILAGEAIGMLTFFASAR